MLPWKGTTWCRETHSDWKWASPKWAAESITNSQAVSSSPPRKPISSPTFNSLDGVWFSGVSLPWEEIKGNKCIGKGAPAICTLEMPSGMEKRKTPHPAHSWENGATSSTAPFHPRPLHGSRPAFHHPLPPCALAQRDQITSIISEFLKRSPTHSLNFTNPCQRP